MRRPEDVRRAVDRWAGRGFAWVRVGGPISAGLLATLIEEAHARGLDVVGRLGRAPLG